MDETRWVELTVRRGLPDVGIVYANDAGDDRFFIDGESVVGFELREGQVLRAEVNPEGYVLRAELLRDSLGQP